MNWKLRIMNKAVLIPLIVNIVALVYMVLGIFGITPGISQDTVLNVAYTIVGVLVTLGIVVDPTTAGVNDSKRAMGYSEPYKDEEDFPKAA